MTTVFATGDNEKIQALLKDYNDRADAAKAALKKLNEAGSGATPDQISEADTQLVLAKKRIVELQQAYKREVDLKAERVRQAAAEAQAALDAAKAVKLTQEEELALLQELSAITAFDPSEDPEVQADL